MEARKGNKIYQVEKLEADQYAAMGYDIYDGKKLVKHAVGKSVPIEQYEALQQELEALKKPKGKKED